MPVKLERHLQAEARQKGYKRGSERYNAYVYGTMNKLGMLSHNHAGNLGPDKLLHKADYSPTFTNVKGVHIAIVVVIIFLVIWWMKGGSMGPMYTGSYANGDGASRYLNTASYKGWVAYQYNSLGAQAGALNGESN